MSDLSPGSAAVPVRLRVAVVVLTFRRPDDISATLPLLLSQAREVSAGDRYVAHVLVVDNDPAGGARPAADALAAPDLEYVLEPQPGISAARNRAITHAADTDLLAFIDDDERPAPGWLAALLATQQQTGAAAVAGSVVSRFEGALDPWIEAGGFFARRHRTGLPTGTPVPVAATNNLLLDLRAVRRLGLRFDPAFGLSGGEDSLFTRTLTRSGERLVWCADAAVSERVPADRVTRRWVLLRSVSSGNSEARVELRLAGGPVGRLGVRARYLGGGVARALGGGLRAGFGFATGSPRHAARGLRAAARGVGMAGGALNWRYEEYRRTLASPAAPADATSRRPAA